MNKRGVVNVQPSCFERPQIPVQDSLLIGRLWVTWSVQVREGRSVLTSGGRSQFGQWNVSVCRQTDAPWPTGQLIESGCSKSLAGPSVDCTCTSP